MKITAGWLLPPSVVRRTCDYCYRRLPEDDMHELVRGDETYGWICEECTAEGDWVLPWEPAEDPMEFEDADT